MYFWAGAWLADGGACLHNGAEQMVREAAKQHQEGSGRKAMRRCEIGRSTVDSAQPEQAVC